MEAADVIGYIVSMIVFMIFFGRHIFFPKRRQPEEEEHDLDEDEQKKALKNFLREINDDMDDMEEEPIVKKKATPPPAPPKVHKPQRKVADDFRYQTTIEQRKFETKVQQRRLETAVETRKRDFGANIVSPDLQHKPDAYARALVDTQPPSRAQKLVSRLGSKKEMFMLQEILNPPKALRKP